MRKDKEKENSKVVTFGSSEEEEVPTSPEDTTLTQLSDDEDKDKADSKPADDDASLTDETKTVGHDDLKLARKEIHKANLARLKKLDNEDEYLEEPPPLYDQLDLHHLHPIKDLLEALPSSVAKGLRELAQVTISHAILRMHRSKRVQFLKDNPSYVPKPLRFKYTLECGDEFQEAKWFQQLNDESNRVVAECKAKLRTHIVKSRSEEAAHTKNLLQSDFFRYSKKVFGIYTAYIREK